MASTPDPAKPIRFQHWELRPVERVLLVRGQPVVLGSRAFDVLLVLVERRGEVVSKAELLNRAWPGLVVEENNVSVQITTLRRLLGAPTITTISGLGYQLSAVQQPPAPPDAAVSPADPPPKAPATWHFETPRLFGREADLQALIECVGAQPLVSIIGTGGVGKTSLAKAVLAGCTRWPPHAVHWVDLAPLAGRGDLVPLVAKVLGIALEGSAPPPAALALALSQENALIALDNCEHVSQEAGELVAHALAAAPGVCWLVTSQVPLHLSRERVYRLDPLRVPPAGAAFDDAVASGAIALLYHRGAAVDRAFELNPSNIAMAIDLCRQLDGLPLAIEMAAARISTLGLQGVHRLLVQRLRMVGPADGPGRHHRLRSTLAWSHDLLSSAEQKVFRRLEPFVGGFGLDMAQRLASDTEPAADAVDEWQAVEALSALVDKSLVHRDADEAGRYHLLESARDFAREQLAAVGETTRLRRRHAEVVAGGFDLARVDYERLRDPTWRALYVPDRANVRAALTWACGAGDPDLLARLVAALAQIDSFVRGQAEVVQCNVPLDLLYQAAPPLRAAACLELSWAHFLDGSRKTGAELAQRALHDFEALADTAGTYRALAQLSRLYESRGMADEANAAWVRFRRIDERDVPLRTRLFCAISGGPQYGGGRSLLRLQQLQEVAQRAGFDTLVTVCLVQITDELLVQRRFADAVETARRFVGSSDLSPRIKGTILMNMVLALVQLGRTAEVYEPARAAVRALPNDAYLVITHLALAAAREGRLVDAALMTGHCRRVRFERGEEPDEAERAATDETTVLMKQGLAADHFDELLRAGAVMSVADVLAIAVP